mmetsp:Transcript_26898/g.70667  ORF Transcript_26898/g.70667 Transcript_26898/m.70667 type:complete len:274 (-) Transcript_26898:468-1289(-)
MVLCQQCSGLEQLLVRCRRSTRRCCRHGADAGRYVRPGGEPDRRWCVVPHQAATAAGTPPGRRDLICAPVSRPACPSRRSGILFSVCELECRGVPCPTNRRAHPTQDSIPLDGPAHVSRAEPRSPNIGGAIQTANTRANRTNGCTVGQTGPAHIGCANLRCGAEPRSPNIGSANGTATTESNRANGCSVAHAGSAHIGRAKHRSPNHVSNFGAVAASAVGGTERGTASLDAAADHSTHYTANTAETRYSDHPAANNRPSVRDGGSVGKWSPHS